MIKQDSCELNRLHYLTSVSIKRLELRKSSINTITEIAYNRNCIITVI